MPDPYPMSKSDRFDARVSPPGSKSMTNRALAMALLSPGTTSLRGVLFADDTRVMLEAMKSLGRSLEIDQSAARVVIEQTKEPCLRFTPADLHLGNAGTATRFLTAAICLGSGEFTIDGIPRMRERPIGELVDALHQIAGEGGSHVTYRGVPGFPPLQIHAAGLAGGQLILRPTLSSQFISALLLAAPAMAEGLRLSFDGPITSLPYVIMTIEMMRQFGIALECDTDYRSISIAPGQQYACRGDEYMIEPDASNASYFLAAAAVTPGSHVTIDGLGEKSLQGDAKFIETLKAMNAQTEVATDHLQLTGPDRLRGIDVDLNDMPDMAQTLAVVALFAEGSTTIRNIGNLRVKETDRLAALKNELTRLGAGVAIDGDDLTIHPRSDHQYEPVTIQTYDDHRMAMSFAVAGLRTSGLCIADPACVNKTYPDFFHDLEAVIQQTGKRSGTR